MTTLTTTPFILNAINYGPILLPRSHPNSHPADQNQHARLGLGGTPALFIYQNDHLYLLPHDMYGGAGGRMKLLGRHRDEERSLLPKRVFFLGEEGDAAGGIAFEAASERGRFYVKCAGIFLLSFLCVWGYGAGC